ncbi:glyoxal oxidase [Sistotremastrum niveocremeum HHB9708]|uniref:Glyoxal oxidase n=1 Tax=Sistotremastrum niveocremeum HHB9708 TaxID=1314777 RepID=A0A164SCU5_9AGAM|nr:glyoxal oxidase [Sistotremastrum niveocremeum HHB9708]
MFLGNEEKVYILDKVEANEATIDGHHAWAAVWDIASSTAELMDMTTNTFCASGMHLPNGSFATFGGNAAIGPQGEKSDQGEFDSTYQDYDGAQAIRILNPCSDDGCQWYDGQNQLQMARKRWYAGTEALADGSVVLMGGFVGGGYVNRNLPNTDPTTEGGGAEPSFEFYPPRSGDIENMQFMTTTSGLNAYAHAYLMPSGKMFVQANLSTILWDYNNNLETPLPDMPKGVVRVYPASGAVAMLPLTPANNYTPSILFCGGSDMPADAYGDYLQPNINTFDYPSSNDCQRITPEPQDGSAPVYVQDDDMLEGRTMGQFVILPDGTLLVINGAANGTAGYAYATGQTALFGDMPFGMSLAAGPVLTPAIYNPNAAAGSRWSRGGLQSSQIPRMYHSVALLLPDASVLIAGSNPNVDVNLTTSYPTTYRAERFYPSYFSATTRPVPTGVPKTLSYGGSPFDIQLSPSSYTGSANDAAANTTVVIVRPGFTTHALNMGQRFLQLNNTYTVLENGTITLHVSQVPPNPNLITPGPLMLFVVVDGVPSNGTMVIVGNGQIGTQPTHSVQELPAIVTATPTASSTPSSSPTGSGSGHKNNAVNLSSGVRLPVFFTACAVLCAMFS